MCPALLMPRNYKSNRRIIQLIEQGQYHPARIAKHHLDVLGDQRLPQDLVRHRIVEHLTGTLPCDLAPALAMSAAALIFVTMLAVTRFGLGAFS